MIIRGHRIRNLIPRLSIIQDGQQIIIGLSSIERFHHQIQGIGFSTGLEIGETILPAASFGPVSLYNAEGRYIVHHDQPMETAYRQIVWHWKEWQGRYDSVEQSRIVDVPYKRYPRTFEPPPSVEFTISADTQGNRVIVTPPITFNRQDHHRILHTINLFLEIFGECNVMDRNLDQIVHAPVRRMNWRILPQGRIPWQRLHQEIGGIIDRQPDGNRPIITHRLQSVNGRQPEFVAVGNGGFDGYVIFAFPRRHLFILECIHMGNATYVFGDDWETLSQRTKAEILQGNLQRARLIHRENWDQELAALFG